MKSSPSSSGRNAGPKSAVRGRGGLSRSAVDAKAVARNPNVGKTGRNGGKGRNVELPQAREGRRGAKGFGGRYGKGRGQGSGKQADSRRSHWHPWYGYTKSCRRPWWNPYCGHGYYPSYYYSCHWRNYRYCHGWGNYWDYSPYCSWYYPGYGYSGNCYYPYYTSSLGYPYYRYAYVGSGPYGDDSASYDYYDDAEYADEAEDPAVVNNYYYGDVYADPTAAGAAAPVADARSSALPEAAPPAAARILAEAEYHLRLGDEAFLSGDYNRAVEAYGAAVKSEPGAAVAHFALAEALLATADYHQAAFEVREGLQLDAGWIQSDFDRKTLFRNEAEFKRIAGQLAEYVGSHPYDAAAQFLFGYAQFFSGERTAALIAFGEAARLRGGDADAEKFIRLPAATGVMGPPAPLDKAGAPEKAAPTSAVPR